MWKKLTEAVEKPMVQRIMQEDEHTHHHDTEDVEAGEHQADGASKEQLSRDVATTSVLKSERLDKMVETFVVITTSQVLI